VESGPAGGAIFAAGVAQELGIDKMLALDVGGTTAKICFIDNGKPQRSQGFEVARMHRFRKGSGLPLRIPVVEMVEIGAGGGSIAHLDTVGRLAVGPHSAGSEPGPASYGRGGVRPTVTDADLVLGRIDQSSFAGGTFRLDIGAAETALGALSALDANAQMLALGVSEIVDETMAGAARVHAVEQGATVEDRTLVAFGGAAPLHAGRVAEKLGINRVIVPKSAGVGSAVGFLRAPIAYEIARSLNQRIATLDFDAVNAMLTQMSAEANAIVARGDPAAQRTETRTAFARYCGQGYEIPVEVPVRKLGTADRELLQAAFEAVYRGQYGGVVAALPVEILTWRVSVSTQARTTPMVAEPDGGRDIAPSLWRQVLDPASGTILAYGQVRRDDLQPGDRIKGPALIVEDETTTVVSPRFDAIIDARGYIVLNRTIAQDGTQS
jgi:N-methylhydantoinase A